MPTNRPKPTAKRTRASKSSKAAPRRSPRGASALPPSRGRFVCSFIERYLVHGEGDFYGKPFRLTPRQKAFIYRAYELGPDGRRRYRRVLKGEPKGKGKTELAAAIGCVELAAAGREGFPGSPLIPVGAASFQQADLLFGAARVMIGEGPLGDFFEVFDTEILRKDGPGRMYKVAAAAGTNDGARPTFFLADELHEWTGSKERVHIVLANGLAKRADGWELNITTAGSDLETLCGQLYHYGKRIQDGELDDDTFLFDWLEAPEHYDLADPAQLEQAVRHCYQDAEAFVSIEPIIRRFRQIPQFEWERYYLNRWTEAPDAWLPVGAWDALNTGATIPEGAEVVVIVDVGIKHDSSGVVELALVDGKVVPRAHVWALHKDPAKPPPPAHTVVKGKGPMRIELLEQHIRALERDRGVIVRKVIYDERFFVRSAQDLEEEFDIVEYPNSVPKKIRDSRRLYEAITEGRIEHDGDPVLRAHVLAGALKPTGDGAFLSRASATRHVDALICIQMGLEEIEDGEPGSGWDQGLVTIG